MEFKKYCSIENSYREKEIEKIKSYVNVDEHVWYVQEKVHGANFSIYFDGRETSFGKRTSFIEEGENFYKWDSIKEKLEPLAKACFESIDSCLPIQEIIIYGELLGGTYPHPLVRKNAEAPIVQKGVFYSPNLEFVAFDLMIKVEDQHYLFDSHYRLFGVEAGNSFLEDAGFYVAPILFKGTFKECLDFNNDLNTKVPALLGLPEIEDNTSEGVIIKPGEALFQPNGARIILKNKNEKFQERKQERKQRKQQKEPVELPDELVELIDISLEYVTEARLNNVLSKIGELERSKIGQAMGMLSKDAVEDFEKDYADKLISYDKSERKHISKAVTQAAKKLVLRKI